MALSSGQEDFQTLWFGAYIDGEFRVAGRKTIFRPEIVVDVDSCAGAFDVNVAGLLDGKSGKTGGAFQAI